MSKVDDVVLDASASPSWSPTTLAPTSLAPTASTSTHEFGAINTLMLVILLALCVLAGYVLQERHFKYLPESGASLLLGAVAGGIIRLAVGDDNSELDLLQFSPLIFFFVLLPPIIFEAGYTLKKKRFFANVVAIGLYAIVGTFISTFTVGFLTYIAALIGIVGVDSSSPLQSLLFGSLISSVDPVATLAILGSSEVNCDPLLYSLVFGESVLNDAVAIVLFHVMNSYAVESKSFAGHDIIVVILRFFGMTIASVLIGVGCGLLCSFVFKFSSLHKYHAYEIQMLFLFSFGCFALSELLGMSGVVALFFCALTLSHYNYYNLSVQTKISSRYVFESLAKTSETVVFVYMGLSIFITKSTWDPFFILFGTFFCVVGRAANIFPMTYLANLCRAEKISHRMQIFMFFSGLRGAVSYALSQQLTTDTGSERSIEIIQTTTLGITIITTFMLGGTTSHMLERLDLKRDANASTGDELREDFTNYHELPEHRLSVSSADEDLSHLGPRALRVRRVRSKIEGMWRYFDEQYMKRLFGGKRHQKSRISPELFNAIQDGDISHFVVNENGSIHSNGNNGNSTSSASNNNNNSANSSGPSRRFQRRLSTQGSRGDDAGASLLLNGAMHDNIPTEMDDDDNDHPFVSSAPSASRNVVPMQIGMEEDGYDTDVLGGRSVNVGDDDDDDVVVRVGHYADEDEEHLERFGMNAHHNQ